MGEDEKEGQRGLTVLGADTRDLSFYRGNDLVLPGLGQELALADEGGEADELRRRKERLSTAPREERRESVREYIRNTRSILLAKIAMHEKKKEAERMREYIHQKESVLNLNKDVYEQDKAMINKYVDFMNNEAFAKKKCADKKAKERQSKEAERERLIQQRANLKKDLGDNREICATYKTHVDFLASLNPEVAKRPRRTKKFFMTEQGVPKESEAVADKELKEIKDELGLSENDSDTEISPGFSSVNELLELLNKQAADNLTLIQDLQKREESLERMRKEYGQTIETKTTLLNSIRTDLNDLREEEKRKLSRFSELADRMESNSLKSNATLYMSEEKLAQTKSIKKLKQTIKWEINEIKSIFVSSDKHRLRESFSEPSKKNSVAALTFITDCLLKLKMVRDWRFMTEGKASLLRRELEEKDRSKQLAAKEARTKNMEMAKLRREKLRTNWLIPRYRKFGKEMMRRKVLKEGPRKREVKVEQKTDNEFDDKYFVE